MAWFYSIGPAPLFLKVFAVICLSRAEPFPETRQVIFWRGQFVLATETWSKKYFLSGRLLACSSLWSPHESCDFVCLLMGFGYSKILQIIMEFFLDCSPENDAVYVVVLFSFSTNEILTLVSSGTSKYYKKLSEKHKTVWESLSGGHTICRFTYY